MAKKHTHWKKRILIGSVSLGALIVLYLGLGSWVVSDLVKDLMLNTHTKITEEINGSVQTKDPLAGNYDGNPRHALGYDYQDVTLKTEVGDQPAWFIPAGNNNTTWAIYVHGIDGRRENGYTWLSVLHPQGYPTLLMSYRNDQGSPPDPSHMFGYGQTEWHDVQTATDYAYTHGAKKVILFGDSMGGAIIGTYLKNSKDADKVEALMLDSPALDMPGVVREKIADRHLPFSGLLTSLGLWVADHRYPIQVGKVRVKPEVEQFKGPLFIAHGNADSVVPDSISKQAVGERLAPTTFLHVAGADHVQSWKKDPADYRIWLTSFLQTIQK